MKNKIQEYMIEAERYARSVCDFYGHSDCNRIRNEKFAELIVKECAQVCYDSNNRQAGNFGDDIKKHFGIE